MGISIAPSKAIGLTTPDNCRPWTKVTGLRSTRRSYCAEPRWSGSSESSSKRRLFWAIVPGPELHDLGCFLAGGHRASQFLGDPDHLLDVLGHRKAERSRRDTEIAGGVLDVRSPGPVRARRIDAAIRRAQSACLGNRIKPQSPATWAYERPDDELREKRCRRAGAVASERCKVESSDRRGVASSSRFASQRALAGGREP